MEGAGFIRAHSEKVELKTNIFEEDKPAEEADGEEEYIYQDEDGNAINLADLQKLQAEGDMEFGDLEGVEDALAQQMLILREMHAEAAAEAKRSKN